MAIDTRKKRQAIASVGMPWIPPAIVPDGSLDLFDRQVIGWGYGGIEVAGVVTAGLICVETATIKYATASSGIKYGTATASIRC